MSSAAVSLSKIASAGDYVFGIRAFQEGVPLVSNDVSRLLGLMTRMTTILTGTGLDNLRPDDHSV
jgi:hypothetical protein